MKLPAFTIRQWISIGLCMLGFAMPVLFWLYVVFFFHAKAFQFPSFLDRTLYQWLPPTILLWLLAAYVYPDGRWRLIAWILFVLGALLSTFAYAVWHIP
jgi:hypothetical protein